MFWVAIGCLAICAPHLASSPSGVVYAWSGLPYTGELVALTVASLFAARFKLPDNLRKRLPHAVLAAAALMLAFEAVAAIFGAFAAHFIPLALVEGFLHVAAVFLWLLRAAPEEDVRSCSRFRVSVASAFLALGGALWFAATAAMRAANAHAPQLELLMWAAALACALPYALAVQTFANALREPVEGANCLESRKAPATSRREFWRLAAAPFVGAFIANRTWLFALRLGVEALVFPKGWPVLFAGALLAIVAFALLKALPRSEGEDASAEVPQSHEPSANPELPLYLIPGCQTLSSRERQILVRTLGGATSADVADELGVAATTVRTYRARAYEKLGVAGPEEVLAALRLAIEEPVPMPAEPVADMSPAMRTAAERMAPPVAAAAVGSLSAAAIFATWALLPVGMRLAACVILSLAALVAGALLTGQSSQAEGESRFALVSLATGVSAACALAAIVAGPFSFALRRTLLAAAIVAFGAWIVYRARPFDKAAISRAVFFAGFAGIALVPQGANAQAFLRSLLPFAACCALLACAGLVLQGMLKDRLAQVASIALKGDARVLAYFEGRGIPSLQAQVALLTARDYPLGGIAATLSLSASAVTQSRMRTYRELGVSNKDGLVALLVREAGLDAGAGGKDA